MKISVNCPDGGASDCAGTVEIDVADDATNVEIENARDWAPCCPACGTDQPPPEID